MKDKLFLDYKQAHKKLGFEPVGRIINIDDILTESGGKLGIGMECLDRDLWEYEIVRDEIKKLGIHMARLQSGWQKSERTEGVYDVAWLDSVVESLSENGIEPLLCLSYGNKIYCDNPEEFPNIQHGGVGHMPIETERERNGWLNYVRFIVDRYKNKIKYYEIWNEADVKSFLHSDKPWCDCYMELVKITAPVIRSVYPDAVILSCTATLDNGELLVDMGVAKYVDVHSFHNYCVWPELRLGEQQNVIDHIKSKAKNLGIWRGEAGFPSYNDPRSNGALSKNVVSEAMQAKFILRHITCDVSNDALDKTFYFHAYDFKHFKGIVRYHYGVLRHEGQRRKPSYYCLQMMAHLFSGSVKANNEYRLSFAYEHEPSEGKLSHEGQMNMRFFTFEKNNAVFFAYYLQCRIENEVVSSKTELSMPCVEGLENPVILDPLTRNIYPVTSLRRFTAPVTDYPMFIVNADMLKGISEINGSFEKGTDEKEIKQFFEE